MIEVVTDNEILVHLLKSGHRQTETILQQILRAVERIEGSDQ